MDRRVEVYTSLSSLLSQEAAAFWAKRLPKIEVGIIYDGRVARNLKFFAKYIRPLVHRDQKCKELMRNKSATAQVEFYKTEWNTLKWRLIFKLFFSETILKKLAPDPDFFNYIDQDIASYLLNKTANFFQSKLAQDNYILQYALFGNFGDCLHHFIQKENFELIKKRLDRITLETGFFQNPIKRGERFDGFNLSNIFEYTTPSEFIKLQKHLETGANPSARFVYWNILVPRRLSKHSELITTIKDSSLDKHIADRAWVYFRCLVDEHV